MELSDFKVEVKVATEPGQPNKVIIADLDLVMEAYAPNQVIEFSPNDLIYMARPATINTDGPFLDFDFDVATELPNGGAYYKVIENDNLKTKAGVFHIFFDLIRYYAKNYLGLDSVETHPVNDTEIYDIYMFGKPMEQHLEDLKKKN